MRRREMGRDKKPTAGTMAAVVFYTSLNLVSCAPAAIPSYQTPRYSNLDEKTLVVKKKTAESEFIELLKEKKASNIICTKGYLGGNVVSAVTADYMSHVYLFKEGGYFGKLEIAHDKYSEPVFPVAKIVHYDGGIGVFLVAKDLKYNNKRVAQLMLVDKEGVQKNLSISIEKLIKKHGEIWDPYIGGESLETGVFFTGRMHTWEIWPSAYKITYDGKDVHMKKVTLGELAQCSCFDKWRAGEDVFHIKVE